MDLDKAKAMHDRMLDAHEQEKLNEPEERECYECCHPLTHDPYGVTWTCTNWECPVEGDEQ